MTRRTLCASLLWLAPTLALIAGPGGPAQEGRAAAAEASEKENEMTVEIHYLEIVTPDVDETCGAFVAMHQVTFSDPVPELGNARVAPLKAGGHVGVRAPMHAEEEPVVRPYLLVDDLDAAVEAAVDAGGELMVPSMEIPERGRCAIYMHGGVQRGLWEL